MANARLAVVAAFHLIAAGGFAHAADPSKLKRFEFTGVHMGTEWRLALYASDKPTAATAGKAAFARVAELEKVMTDYDPKSELMTLCATNDAAPGKPIPVSDDLLRVLVRARHVGELSGGAFDVTVGPLVKLWRTARKSKELPAAKDIAAAKALVGLELWSIDEKAKTVTLSKAGMRLDLGGIGKGFAADEALAVLRKNGVSRALVAASGDITVGDAPPDKEAWVVEIASLQKGDPVRLLKLANASVSTSGDLFQSVEIGGVRYSHVLDPKTGLGMTGYRSGTVVADKGWKADALTKAALLLPPEQAMKAVEGEKGVMFLAVKETVVAKEEVIESKRFRALLVEEKK